MALQAIVHCDGFSYNDDIVAMDAATIAKSKERFRFLQQQGVIRSGDYDDNCWVLSNEVIKGATINYRIDEVHFMQKTANQLACSLKDYQQAMRIVITSRFGYSLDTLQSDIAVMRNFANDFAVPSDYVQAQLLADLLALLPGDTAYRREVQSIIDDISPLESASQKRRTLAYYQSYLRFAVLIDTFWDTASDSERVLYFPIWFWYKITAVLPLRPTECVLTPRHCIRIDGEKYFLTVRRSRLKGHRQSSRYSIDSDYEMVEYPIPEKLARPIQEYITATQDAYKSDIDVLWCKTSQFVQFSPYHDNDQHYTYANLQQCLARFYRNVIREKLGYEVVQDRDNLTDNEISKIRLGDTRHIAMIALVISGGNPSICKELAGHDSIAVSAHYYSNLTQFLDVLGYERWREIKVTSKQAYGLEISQKYPVSNGYCQSKQVWAGDYSPCVSAVNTDGIPGSCSVCKWFFPAKPQMPIVLSSAATSNHNGAKSAKEEISLEMQQTHILLRQSIEQLRHGLGAVDVMSALLDRLSAQAQQYVHTTAMEYLVREREEKQL